MPAFAPQKKTRADILLTARGLITESFSHISATVAALTPTSGRVYWSAIGLRAGDVVTNIHVNATGVYTLGGGTISMVKVGLLDTSGTVLKASADVQAAYTSTGVKTHALASTYTAPADGAYLCAILYVAGGTPPTTAPTFGRAANDLSQGSAVGSGVNLFGDTSATSATDFTGPYTIRSQAPALWFAVS
jgi:hypothetical protein